MDGDRRGLIKALAATACLSLFPHAAAAAARGADKPYGVITIAVSGITMSVYRIDRAMLSGKGKSGFEQFGFRRIDTEASLVASPLHRDGDATTIDKAVEIVATNIAKLQNGYSIADSDIAIIGSSALASYVGAAIDELPARLKSRTGLNMRLLTAREEAQLEYDWIVPARHRGEVLHLEISAGDIKGGYYQGKGRQQDYHDLSVPFGTRNFAGAVKFAFPSVRTGDFGARAAELYDQTVAPLVQDQLASLPGAMDKPKVYLSGGIVWATAVILHPEQMALLGDWVRLSPEDFSTIRRLIEDGTPYGRGLPSSLTTSQRSWVTKNLGFIRKLFNPHQLAAGAALGAGIARQIDLATRDEVSFPVFANGASSSQYLLHKIRKDKGFV